MNTDQRLLRKFIFDHFFENTTAPTLEETMQEFSLGRRDAFARFKELEADHHILLVPGTQRILMANPFSAVTTPFRVNLDGRRYFANCAWDTVSMHIMFGADVAVEAHCHHCAEPIEVKLSGGKVRSSNVSMPLIFLSVPVSKWYDNLIDTCSNNMVYFLSKEHMNRWLVDNPQVRGESLSVEKMAQVCVPLSRGRMTLQYERPPKEEIAAYWDSIGMKSEFWKF